MTSAAGPCHVSSDPGSARCVLKHEHPARAYVTAFARKLFKCEALHFQHEFRGGGRRCWSSEPWLAAPWCRCGHRNPPRQRQRDAIEDAQRPASVAATRVEQNKTAHDRAIDAKNAPPNSTDSGTQPKQGRITGFDFFRDPLNAAKPNQSPEEIMKTEIANKPKVMAAQRKLLETRYILQPKLDPDAKMQYGLSDCFRRPLHAGTISGGADYFRGELWPQA